MGDLTGRHTRVKGSRARARESSRVADIYYCAIKGGLLCVCHIIVFKLEHVCIAAAKKGTSYFKIYLIIIQEKRPTLYIHIA